MTEVNTQKLMEDLKRVATDAEELLKATAGLAGEKAEEVKSRLTAIAESARNTYQKLEQTARAQAQTADQVIRTHPYESVGIAFGIGVLLGVLLGRR